MAGKFTLVKSNKPEAAESVATEVADAPVASVASKAESPAAPRKLKLVLNGELYRRVRKPFVTEDELRAIGRSPEGCVKAGFAVWV